MNAEVVRIEHKIPGLVLADDLEAVTLGHTDGNHRFVHNVSDLLTVSGILAFAEINTNEGMVSTPEGWGSIDRRPSHQSVTCMYAHYRHHRVGGFPTDSPSASALPGWPDGEHRHPGSVTIEQAVDQMRLPGPQLPAQTEDTFHSRLLEGLHHVASDGSGHDTLAGA